MSCSTGTKLLQMQFLAVLLVSAALCAPNASAQDNLPPPSGAILDLAGQSINHGAAVTESVSFMANLANTDITFAFRDDSYYVSFSDVSLTDTTTHSLTNLILNPYFALGSGHAATDWGYANIYGATPSGEVSASCSGGLSSCWFDGAVQAYDAVDQEVATTIGDTYLLSFAYSENSSLSTFSDLSTNGITSSGGNGVDILAYEQAGLPPAGTVTPEPDSIVLMSTGALMLGAAFYYKRRNGMGDIF